MLTKLCLLSTLLSLGAYAQTVVHLATTGCTASRIAYSVPNDGVNPDGTPLQIDYISASATYGRVTASINGVLWDSGLYAVYPMPLNLINVPLHDAAGHQLSLSASYTHWATLNRSGHNFYVQHWRLDSGTLVVP
jgi:hypothetical protein